MIVTADELIIAFGWLAGAFTKKVLFETAQSENLGETTVLMNSQHSSQQKFFDLLGELKFRAIFLFALGVMYHVFGRKLLSTATDALARRGFLQGMKNVLFSSQDVFKVSWESARA